MSEYKFENTIGGRLVKQLGEAVKDCFEYQGKSLREWEAKNQRQERIAAERRAKEERAERKERNIENYRNQAEALSEFNEHGHFTGMTEGFTLEGIDVDEHAQYRNEMKFAAGCKLDLEDE